MTAPRTVKDLRARISARGLDWTVKSYPPNADQHKRHYTMWILNGRDVMICKSQSRLRCLELAWRLVKSERVDHVD
jgi:hypothetical protein